jgi:large subunit ribosomal protein L54
MFVSRVLRRPASTLHTRLFASESTSAVPKAVQERTTAAGSLPTEGKQKKNAHATALNAATHSHVLTAPASAGAARSSCAPNTALVGLNYLKDQPPVLALPDEEYPPWLWNLLDKSELPDDGPGGKAEKRRLRKENRQRIRDQNFMKTQ